MQLFLYIFKSQNTKKIICFSFFSEIICCFWTVGGIHLTSTSASTCLHLREPIRSSRWTARRCWPGTPTTASVSGSRHALWPPPCLSGTSGRRQEAWTHTLTHNAVTHSHVMCASSCVDPRLLQQRESPLYMETEGETEGHLLLINQAGFQIVSWNQHLLNLNELVLSMTLVNSYIRSSRRKVWRAEIGNRVQKVRLGTKLAQRKHEIKLL